MFPIAGDVKTNTLRSKTYDHILIDRTMTREFTGRFGVLDLQNGFGLTEQQALTVSDHQPAGVSEEEALQQTQRELQETKQELQETRQEMTDKMELILTMLSDLQRGTHTKQA